MEPGDIYILTIVVTALVVAPFNALARIIVLAWIVAHLGYVTGMPEAWANLAGHLTVFALGMRQLHSAPAIMTWALSIPLVVVDTCLLSGFMSPFHAWWAVLGLALAQLALLPFATDRETQMGVAKVWHRGRDGGFLRERAT